MRTPSLVVDRAVLDANVALMQERCDAARVALRPHVKGHKCAWVAARQLAAGASGLAAATLGEARGLLAAGLGGDVLLTSVVAPPAAADVVALQALGDLAVVVDDVGLVEALAGSGVRVFVDVDIGQHRAGAASVEQAQRLREAIDGAGLRFAGVQAYEGHLQLLAADEQRSGHRSAMEVLRGVVDALEPPVVTGAGTGTARLAFESDLVTEVQPGSYALMDATYARVEPAFGQAAHVHTTVRSRVEGGVVCDAGFKAVSIDSGPAAVADREATWTPAGDEHGLLRGDVDALAPGDVVRLVPSHTDTTVALHRSLWVGDAEVPLV